MPFSDKFPPDDLDGKAFNEDDIIVTGIGAIAGTIVNERGVTDVVGIRVQGLTDQGEREIRLIFEKEQVVGALQLLTEEINEAMKSS